MKKILITPRQNWQTSCLEDNFFFHSLDGRYWIEDYAFEFSQKQANTLYQAATEINEMCLDLISDIVKKGEYHHYRYPIDVCEQIENSWKRKDFNLYGRFDFSYNGKNIPKLLEYNADTPTTIIESSLVQQRWLKEQFPNDTQCNEIISSLIERWQKMPYSGKVHLAAHNVSEEDWCNVKVLEFCAKSAGIQTEYIDLQDIGWNEEENCFVDLQDKKITTLFKLHPWELLITDNFYPQVLRSKINIIEPMWKMLLSSKAILPLLWERNKNHPNLLPAFFDEQEMLEISSQYVKKPIYSREGANVTIYDKEVILDTQTGSYGAEGYVYQQRQDLACFDNRFSMLGLWMSGDKPCGLAIREDKSLITKDTSWFIPHYVR